MHVCGFEFRLLTVQYFADESSEFNSPLWFELCVLTIRSNLESSRYPIMEMLDFRRSSSYASHIFPTKPHFIKIRRCCSELICILRMQKISRLPLLTREHSSRMHFELPLSSSMTYRFVVEMFCNASTLGGRLVRSFVCRHKLLSSSVRTIGVGWTDLSDGSFATPSEATEH